VPECKHRARNFSAAGPGGRGESPQALGDGNDVVGPQHEPALAFLGHFAHVHLGDFAVAVDTDFLRVGEFGESAGAGEPGDDVEFAVDGHRDRARFADLPENGDGFVNKSALVDDDSVAGIDFDAIAVFRLGGGVGRSPAVGPGEDDFVAVGDFGEAAGGGQGGGEIEGLALGHRKLARAIDRADHRKILVGIVLHGDADFRVAEVFGGIEVADPFAGFGHREPADFDGIDEREGLERGLEIDAAEVALDSNNYDASHVDTLSGTDQWTDPGSDPLAQVKDWKETVRGSIGVEPNTLMLPQKVFNAATVHDTIKNQFKYTSADSLTAEMLMRYFQIDDAPMEVTAENFTFMARHVAMDHGASSFESSDPTLDAVWDLMKHSLYTCAQ